MSQSPEILLKKWLNSLGIKISRDLLNRQLKSHPDYPSLLSITDTLDYLGIENGAFVVEKDQLNEIDTPFLAHLNTNGGDFVLVEKGVTIEKKYPGFIDNWTGVVLAIEKKDNWYHTENEKYIETEKTKGWFNAAGILAFSALLIYSFTIANNWQIPVLALVGIAGTFVSWLIITRELGLESEIAGKVCGSSSDCDTVIKQDRFKLPFGISWGDISISWFISLSGITILSSLTGTGTLLINTLALLSVAGVLLSVFSVYYQWKVVRKWCRLCLITSGLLWAQCLVLLKTLFTVPFESPGVNEMFIIAAAILLTGSAWQKVKNFLVKAGKSDEELLQALRFKRNETVFMELLQKQRRVAITPWEEDFQLGNPQAPVQIMVACNTYCKPCASTHEILHNLLESSDDSIGLTVRFTLAAENNEDNRTKVVGHMVRHLRAVTVNKPAEWKRKYTRKMIHDWFEVMDHNEFVTGYPAEAEADITGVLKLHESWMRESEIKFTPAVFINGYELPKQYEAGDLAGLLIGFANIQPAIKQNSTMMDPV